jgi:hypothetical protein
MGDHGFGQVAPGCHQTFITYSFDVVAKINSGELVVVK